MARSCMQIRNSSTAPNAGYDATGRYTARLAETGVEDMHLEYQALLQADPELESRLKRLPASTLSGRKRPAKGVRGVSLRCWMELNE